jgi:uncharacterized membrane protein YbhN (UPF0104 family)
MILPVSHAARDLEAVEHGLHDVDEFVFEPTTHLQKLVRIVIWLAIVIGTLLLLQAIGIDPIGWVRHVFTTMEDIEPKYLIAGIVFQTVNVLLVGFAYVAIWRSAYPQAGKIPVGQVVACFAVSIALNSVLPMSIGSWVMLFMFLAIIPGATAAGMASGFGVSKMFFFVMGIVTYAYLFISISGALNTAIGGITNHLPALITILILVVVLILVLFKVFRQKAIDSVKNLKQGAAILSTPKPLFLLVLLPQALGYCFQILTTASFMRGYGIPVSIGNIILNNAANSLATITAVTPGGVGATQGLTTIALHGVATPIEIAGYSLAQQLILTAWNCVLATVLVLVFFGWSGGKLIVTNSLVSARQDMHDKRAAGKQAKAERKAAKQAGVEADAPHGVDGTATPPDQE